MTATIQWFPRCFSDAHQYRVWRAAAEGSQDKALKRSSYCTDCKPAYQQEMKLAGRCIHPDTKFAVRAGFLQGVRPPKGRSKCS